MNINNYLTFGIHVIEHKIFLQQHKTFYSCAHGV